MTTLTFKFGKFVLTGNSVEPEALHELWEYTGARKWVTTDLKAAAQFKRHADERAVKIFNRAFVKRYPRPTEPLPLFLDPHQVQGVEWVLTRSRSYLAHAPGAGKTAQAIVSALRADGKGQAVFIVPPSLTVNWAREIEKFWDMTKAAGEIATAWPSIAVVPESTRQEFTGWNAEFLIVPDSMLTREWVLDHLVKIEKRLIAIDEASRFKEAESQRTIALFGGTLKDGRKSPGLIQDARHAVLLDGSPMPNRPMELWAPTFAMSPESIDFMSQNDFGFRYCGAKINSFGRWEFKHSSHENELRTKLQKDFMHVVSEDELKHPERKRSLLIMSDDVRSAKHRSWEQKHLSKIRLDTIDENASQGDIAKYRAELGNRKAPWVADYVSERIDTKGESILLFCWHRDVAFKLEELLRKYNPGLVMGGTPESTRETLFDRFQLGTLKLIIGNIAAMGRGHNLQRADRVIFGEFSWTDETNLQCEKRASRRGRSQDLPVRCDYIVCPNSMDEMILNAVFKKAQRVKRIIG